jgi:hypothetical protein
MNTNPNEDSLTDVRGEELTEEQLLGILAQIDRAVLALLADGKLAAAKYSVPGPAGTSIDRHASLNGLLAARGHYEKLLSQRPTWHISHAVPSAQLETS